MERPYKLNPPEDLEEFIIRCADRAYLIFDRKSDRCRCTVCGTEYRLSEFPEALTHNKRSKMHQCTCYRETIAKESRYGRKNITEYGRVLWFSKDGNATYAELDEYQINYGGWKPKVSFWPSAQYRFEKEKQEYVKHVQENTFCADYWDSRKNIALPRATAGMWNYNRVPRYQKTLLHPSHKTEIGSDLKYADPDTNHLGLKGDPYALIGYLSNFLKYPSIEILEKAGFTKIVRQRALGSTCKKINWRAKDLRKILKLKPAEIREFREMSKEATLYNLEKYHAMKEAGYPIPFRLLRIIPNYMWEEKLKKAGEYVKIKKLLPYLKEQENDLEIYVDYIRECEKLGEDLKNKKVLFPQDLQAAHEETSQKLAIVETAEKKEAFQKAMKKIYGMPEYREEYLLIRPASGPEELIKESVALRHCVRTYVNKVASGACAILFIRKTSEPDKPYFTLELSPRGEIIQCRGEKNGAYTKEIKEFMDRWKSWMKKERKAA